MTSSPLTDSVNLVSAKYIGLWKRESIQLADADPYEDSIVFWLQAEKYFADIRIPLNQPCLPPQTSLADLNADELLKFAKFKAFAGTIDATESWIRWNRLIDFKPDPSRIDQGSVHFAGQNLIEIGEFELGDEIQQYLEVWVPQLSDVGDRFVLELAQELNATTHTITHPKALWVTVGEHFIRIYDDRFYSPDFATPDDVSGAALKQLMQFQADYGKRQGDVPWQIVLSNDPSRVGTSLQAKPNYHAQWLDDILIEGWTDGTGETLEHHWHVRESTGDLELNRLILLGQGQ
jgi:Protein HRI1